MNQILPNPKTPKKLIKKKKKKPSNPKLKIKLLRSSHSIINFIKTGKPLYINNAIHTNKEIKGTMTDIPLKFKIFRSCLFLNLID